MTPIKAPWPDYAGNPIHHGDRLSHPDGTCFTAMYYAEYKYDVDAWKAVYDDSPVPSRLCMQIDHKGRAVLVK